jgi:tripartite-type tricarboxylate transporter receptor subunit TctC
MSAAVTDAAFKERLLNLGVVPAPLSVAAFKAFVTEEIAKYAKVISFANITVE